MLFKPRKKRKLHARLVDLVWPRNGLRRGWRYIWHRLSRIAATPHTIALGFAHGVFMGFSPLIGFHIIIASILCLFTGGSIVAAAFGTMVCNPVSCPIMVYADYKLGTLLLGGAADTEFHFDMSEGSIIELFRDPAHFWEMFWGTLGPVFVPMTIGGTILGLIAAIPSYFAVRFAVDAYQRRRRQRLRLANGRKPAETGP